MEFYFGVGLIAAALCALTVPLIMLGDRLNARARTREGRALAFAPILLGIAMLAIFATLILFNMLGPSATTF